MIPDILVGVGLILLSTGVMRRGLASVFPPEEFGDTGSDGADTAGSGGAPGGSLEAKNAVLDAVHHLQATLTSISESAHSNQQALYNELLATLQTHFKSAEAAKYDGLLAGLQEAQTGAIWALSEIRHELGRSNASDSEVLQRIRALLGDEVRTP